MAVKYNTNVKKGLKLKVKKFWELAATFVEVTRENLVREGGEGGELLRPPSWIGLKEVR